MTNIALGEGEEDPTLRLIVQSSRLAEPVYVSRPTMPAFADFQARIHPLWESGWLTNQGALHIELERRLETYLGVEHLSLFCNGTIALLVALQGLRLTGGEVITTPFTFAATPHVLHWNGVKPVFADIDPRTLNLDPNRIEEHIGPETRAIMPVHVYGTPCDVEAIQAIADRHGLAVVYDAAHAFGVRHKERSILVHGNASILSFHATKLYTTIEGGAVVSMTGKQKERIDFLKNFGIADEETVIGPGINGKLNEMQAAFGLLQLDGVDAEIAARAAIDARYRERLDGVPGLTTIPVCVDTRHNHSYFPVLVEQSHYGVSRDRLNELLRACNIYSRKYFFPLCSHYPCYAALPSSRPETLPVAERAARDILCLPIYGTLTLNMVDHVCDVIVAIHEAAA